jgi:hypothetical protein
MPVLPPTSPREVAMKFADDRAFADPDKAARKLVELANAAEADRDEVRITNRRGLRARPRDVPDGSGLS